MLHFIKRYGAVLFLVFIGAMWFCRGMELAWFQASAAPARAAQSGAGGATPLVQPPADSPTCQTSEPPTSSPYLTVAHADAVQVGVNPLIFTWQIFQESHFQTNKTSAAGAQGIAQFMPETASGLGINPWNPKQALMAAAQDDAGHLGQFAAQAKPLAAHYGGNQARYDYGLALAAYNAGPGATTGAWNRAYANGTAWPASGPWAWLALLGQETQQYIPKILGCSL